MKKIILVDSGSGRVGSSAMMGLLELANINVGASEKELHAGDRLNTKGYFEPASIKAFTKRAFPKYFPGVTYPTMEELDASAKTHFNAFMSMFDAEYRGKYPLAIKTPKCLIFPQLYRLCGETRGTAIYVIKLVRDRQKQVKSIQKMWKANEAVIRKRGWGLHPRFISKACDDFDVFANKVYKHYSVNYHTVAFEDLIGNTKDCAKKLFKFLKHRKPTNKKILEWIDPSLVTK